MTKKFFLLGVIFAALTFTSCGDKLDPNDPTPHCFKIISTDESGATMEEYFWGTDRELQEDFIPGIIADGLIPVWKRQDAKDENACDALADEIQDYNGGKEVVLLGNVFTASDFFQAVGSTENGTLSIILPVKGTNRVGSFTEENFYYDKADEIEPIFSSDGGNTSYAILKASFTGEAIANDPEYKFAYKGWFECENGIRYHLLIKCIDLDSTNNPE